VGLAGFESFLVYQGRRGRRSYFDDMFGGFDQMRKEMEREFEESFKDFETKAPKQTPEG
jgi:hypothetical protein